MIKLLLSSISLGLTGIGDYTNEIGSKVEEVMTVKSLTNSTLEYMVHNTHHDQSKFADVRSLGLVHEYRSGCYTLTRTTKITSHENIISTR